MLARFVYIHRREQSAQRVFSSFVLHVSKTPFFHFVQKKSDLVHTNIFVSRGNQRYKQRYKRTHIIMRGALAPSTRTTTTCYSPTLKKNNVRTKHGSIGPLRSSARKCAVVRVVRSEADNQPESSAAAGAKRSSASAEERERAETLRKVEDAITSEEEIKRNGRMDMDFNPEDFENVDPQLAEDVAERTIESSSVPLSVPLKSMETSSTSEAKEEEEEDVNALKTDMEGMKKTMAENRRKEMDYIVETVLKSERVVARSNVKSIKARKDAESAEMNAVTARELLDEKKDVSEQEISDLEAQIKARLAQDIPKIYDDAGVSMDEVPVQHNPLKTMSGMTAFITSPTPPSGLTNASQAQRMGVPFDPNEQFDIHASYLEKFQNWTPALVFVYVLTHPGSPCIFASKIPDIFGLPDESVLPQERELAKDLLTQEQINDLMEVRRRNDIKAAGTVQNVASEKDLYCALINNRVFVKIGARFELPRDILISSCGKQLEQFDLCCSGHQWAVWQIKDEESDAYIDSSTVPKMETPTAEVPPSPLAEGGETVDNLLEEAKKLIEKEKQELEEEGQRFRDIVSRPHSEEEKMLYSAKLVEAEEKVAFLERNYAKLKMRKGEGDEKLFPVRDEKKKHVGIADESDAEEYDESDVVQKAAEDVDEFESGWA